MSQPNRVRAPERRAGHSRPYGRLQRPHRGIDDSAPPPESEVDEAPADERTCGECGFVTSAKNVARAMDNHAKSCAA